MHASVTIAINRGVDSVVGGAYLIQTIQKRGRSWRGKGRGQRKSKCFLYVHSCLVVRDVTVIFV